VSAVSSIVLSRVIGYSVIDSYSAPISLY